VADNEADTRHLNEAHLAARVHCHAAELDGCGCGEGAEVAIPYEIKSPYGAI